MLRFAWVLNLDAEYELERPTYCPPARLLARLEHHAGDARALLGPLDVLIGRRAVSGATFVGRAWCPTARALAALEAAGVEPEPHPPVDVLTRVNHRRFACELEGGLPGQRYMAARAPLEELLSAGNGPWLLKRPLACAGRGQMRVYGEPDATQTSWIEASLRRDGLVAEPLVRPTQEFSLHGFIWRDNRYEVGRPCVQDISPRGVFRSVRLAESNDLAPAERTRLMQSGERVAAALVAAGYFGPFGVDAYRYEHQGRIDFCALGEINARYTMGFATGFPRHPSELRLA